MPDNARVDMEGRVLVCVACDAVEQFVSNVTGEFLQQIDGFTVKHAKCEVAPEEPFKPGDIVEFCGEEAVVEANFGDSGRVLLPGQGTCNWYWNFQGTPVRRVRRKQ